MATYIGLPIKITDASSPGGISLLYPATYGRAIVQESDNWLLSDSQLSFLNFLMGDEGEGEWEGTKWSDLVADVEDIKVLLEEDTDNVINNLKDIMDFIKNGTLGIGEDVTLDQFIKSLNKLSINGSIRNVAYSIYAPTTAGMNGQISVSNGSSGPVWSSDISVGSIVVDQILPNNTESYIGTIAKPYKTIRGGEVYGNDIRGNKLYANGKDLSLVKNAVVKSGTAPTAAEYGRTELVDGLLWLDTSSVEPSDPKWFHRIQFNSRGIGGGLLLEHINEILSFHANEETEDSIRFKVFEGYPRYGTGSDGGLFYPIVEFESQSGPIAFGIREYSSDGIVCSSYEIRSAINFDNYNTLLRSIITYKGGATPSVKVLETSYFTLPSCRMVTNNIHMLPSTFNYLFRFVTDWE